MTQKPRARQQQTTQMKEQETSHTWLLFDAKGKTLGRLASEIAKVLTGKHKPTFTPHTDNGDGVIILNADSVVVTGHKEAQKLYHHHTGFIGHFQSLSYRRMKERRPGKVVELAIKGMMPKTKQARHQLKRLRIFAGGEHNMAAQKPIKVNI